MIRYQTCTVAAVRASLPRADALHHLRIEHFLRLLELVHEAPFASVTFAAAKHHTRRFRTLSDRLYLVRERYHERERREREKREMCHHQDSSSCDVGDFLMGGRPMKVNSQEKDSQHALDTKDSNRRTYLHGNNSFTVPPKDRIPMVGL